MAGDILMIATSGSEYYLQTLPASLTHANQLPARRLHHRRLDAADQPFGFVFSHCQITGDNPGVKTFLGRPWRVYASTIYLNCEMSAVVRPEGWNDWKKPEAHTTARYAEFNSTGDGASPTNRPAWTKQLPASEAEKITVEKVLGGWRP